jgi:hypothetical protein
MPGEYVVSFSYEVLGKTYRGKYFAGSPHENRETFEILYDPNHPQRNTGSGDAGNKWMKVTFWVAGAALAALILWLQQKFS